MSEEEIFEFLQSLPNNMSPYDSAIALADEAYERGDLYTMHEATKMALAIIRPPDTVRIIHE